MKRCFSDRSLRFLEYEVSFDTIPHAARDESRGNAAVEQLSRLHLHPKFHHLDVTDRESIRRLRDHLREHYGGLDVLVNNAGVSKETVPVKKCVYEASSFCANVEEQNSGEVIRCIL